MRGKARHLPKFCGLLRDYVSLGRVMFLIQMLSIATRRWCLLILLRTGRHWLQLAQLRMAPTSELSLTKGQENEMIGQARTTSEATRW